MSIIWDILAAMLSMFTARADRKAGVRLCTSRRRCSMFTARADRKAGVRL